MEKNTSKTISQLLQPSTIEDRNTVFGDWLKTFDFLGKDSLIKLYEKLDKVEKIVVRAAVVDRLQRTKTYNKIDFHPIIQEMILDTQKGIDVNVGIPKVRKPNVATTRKA